MSTPWTVLPTDLPEQQNYFTQDPVLQALLGTLLSPEARDWLTPQATALGAAVPTEVEPRSALCDRKLPELRQFDRFGRRNDEILYHPAYRELEGIAYGSGMISMKYDPALRARFGGELQVAGFALSYLYAQAETGVSCPACMTDGVARVLELHGTEDQQRRHIPRLAARDLATLQTGAMFLTEKQGGSDVGANATRAVQQADGSWRLFGEKWFCSNVDAGLKLVLARPENAPGGTRGLGLFLVPHRRADGSTNGIRIDRLKDKLGVRSMASGECVLDGTEAELVGQLDQGFKQMAEMLNLSRLWNAVTSVAVVRRAAYEATRYLRVRRTFGKPAIEHALVRETLADLQAESIAGQFLVFHLARSVDRADRGSETDRDLVRMLTPLVKYGTAKTSVWAASEGIELLGGNGYIEDGPMPRLLRDAQVLPVWEGTTNILVLDALRVVGKGGGHVALLEETRRRAREAGGPVAEAVLAATQRAEADLAVIAAEGPDGAPHLLKRFTDGLLHAFQVALLLDPGMDATPAGPSIRAAARRLASRHLGLAAAWNRGDVAALVDATVSAA